MKDLKDILLEGLLKGMDKTLAAGENDVNAALNADIIGIVSDDKKEQEKAVNLFKKRLKDLKVKPTTVKGNYVKNISISSTMGPGVKLDLNSFDK